MLIVKSCVGLKTGKQLEQLKPLKVIHNIYKKQPLSISKTNFGGFGELMPIRLELMLVTCLLNKLN